MGKNELIQRIAGEYAALNIGYTLGGSSDVCVDQEVLDAKFSIGQHKIRYESAILVSEKDRKVYFWEQTKENKSGISFGFSGESSFQSGTALFRKVKAVAYGPEGKVYDVEFDIGRLSKIVKEAADENGYKVKTVLSRKKASY